MPEKKVLGVFLIQRGRERGRISVCAAPAADLYTSFHFPWGTEAWCLLPICCHDVEGASKEHASNRAQLCAHGYSEKAGFPSVFGELDRLPRRFCLDGSSAFLIVSSGQTTRHYV